MGFFDLFKKKQNTQPTTPAERSQPTSPENHRPAAVENTTKQENTSPQPAARTADREQAELNSGLEKTKTGLFSKLARAVAGRSTIDTQVLDDLEEVLITSDVGVETTVKIIERIEARVARDKYMNTSELQSILRDEIAQLMEESHRSTENFGLDVEEGVPYVIMVVGVNGAGKTTAFNCITGVYEPTNGRVDFMGEPIVCNHPRGKMKKSYAGAESERYLSLPTVSYTPDKITKRGIARTFQNIRLFKSMTVFENVLTAMHVRRTSNVFSATFRANHKEEAAQREKALELLKIVGLDDVKDELATALPYGKQRRLEIARALATSPKLLLLDEPAAGMNPQETLELTAFIRSIRDRFGLTIFLIEHHMNLVMDISDRIYVIDFGKQIAAGVPAEIQNDPRVIDAYLGVDEDA